jgi:hypothetical protein
MSARHAACDKNGACFPHEMSLMNEVCAALEKICLPRKFIAM